MRKILAFLLIALFSVSMLTACKEQEDAFSLYTEMKTAMEEDFPIQAKAESKLEGEISGEDWKVGAVEDYTKIPHSETEADYSYVKTTFPLEARDEVADEVSRRFVKDGWLYVDKGEDSTQKMKMKIPFATNNASNPAPFFPLDFDKSAVSQSEVTHTAEGKRLQFTLKGEELHDTLESLVLANVKFMLSYNENPIKSFGDLQYTILLDGENRIQEQRLAISHMEVEMGESWNTEEEMVRFTAEYTLDVSIAYDGGEIEYPADLDAYVEGKEVSPTSDIIALFE